uniref:Uncharacterized protein n=1 Tax=Rhodosorus marinus TaxID=101924 RepID=A0A7S2ZS95_9RHOD|mmetsp:Transcript_30860/g.118352  ORF Transcript_30860/g.118352 Transcript_30860/m.118352 type:complete len:141 (+) Transcript_30860:83-505(+)
MARPTSRLLMTSEILSSTLQAASETEAGRCRRFNFQKVAKDTIQDCNSVPLVRVWLGENKFCWLHSSLEYSEDGKLLSTGDNLLTSQGPFFIRGSSADLIDKSALISLVGEFVLDPITLKRPRFRSTLRYLKTYRLEPVG